MNDAGGADVPQIGPAVLLFSQGDTMSTLTVSAEAILTGELIDIPCQPGAAVLLVGSRNRDRARELAATATLRHDAPWDGDRGSIVHELRMLGHELLEPRRAEAARALRASSELARRERMVYLGGHFRTSITLAAALAKPNTRLAISYRGLDYDALDSDTGQGASCMRLAWRRGDLVEEHICRAAASPVLCVSETVERRISDARAAAGLD
jgi:hypothetical protein